MTVPDRAGAEGAGACRSWVTVALHARLPKQKNDAMWLQHAWESSPAATSKQMTRKTHARGWPEEERNICQDCLG